MGLKVQQSLNCGTLGKRRRLWVQLHVMLYVDTLHFSWYIRSYDLSHCLLSALNVKTTFKGRPLQPARKQSGPTW